MILIALGANLPSPAGPPAETLRRALGALDDRGARVLKVSRFFRSAAWPPSAQPGFVNAVAAVQWGGSPQALMQLLLEVEAAFGRVRGDTWAARPLDLDLLDFEGRTVAEPWLTLPHKHLHERGFVLAPLVDIAPDWRHPALGLTAAALLAGLDPSRVQQESLAPL